MRAYLHHKSYKLFIIGCEAIICYEKVAKADDFIHLT